MKQNMVLNISGINFMNKCFMLLTKPEDSQAYLDPNKLKNKGN